MGNKNSEFVWMPVAEKEALEEGYKLLKRENLDIKAENDNLIETNRVLRDEIKRLVRDKELLEAEVFILKEKIKLLNKENKEKETQNGWNW